MTGDAGRGIIGRGTWIDKLAHELVEREESLGRDMKCIRVESGLGASGIPHIGSLGDAVRAYGVRMALEDSGYNSELIAYSDDLDGLRKIPEGFPDSLKDHIARPVSAIPDPLGCHDSYGMHMSSLLLEGLESLGIRYTFKRARDTYADGLLAGQIHVILENSERIGKMISEMVGQEKFKSSLPYFPICAGCGRLYTARASGYIADERKVAYSCGDSIIGEEKISGCGHAGEADITGCHGKLAWKVEFAARWQAFDVRFEAYGKDIMDSVNVNDRVAEEILGYHPPMHVRYEMFLDKGGKKISKSRGNVLTSQGWLRYGTPQSVLLLLYKRISGAREVGFDDIPGLMAEYDELEKAYFGGKRTENEAKDAKSRGLYEYANLLDPPDAPLPHVNYRLLVELCRIFREERIPRVSARLAKYGAAAKGDPHVERLIELAGNYADDIAKGREEPLEMDDASRRALRDMADKLEDLSDPDEIQNAIYGTAKSHGMRPADFFGLLYGVILDSRRGPRLGPFISDIGAASVADTIRRRTA